MNYLFFDIESANNINHNGNICEFGYLLVDKDFNILETDNIIINPDCEFEKYVRDNILTRPIDEYLKAPLYSDVFDKIKPLFDPEKTRVFGHTVDSDVNYLNEESKRDKLPFLNYDFYDVKLIYEMYSHDDTGLGLVHICEKLKIELPDTAHDALCDATATMGLCKKVCELDGITIDELIDQYSLYCKGTTKDGVVTLNSKHVEIPESEPLTTSIGDQFKGLLDLFKD